MSNSELAIQNWLKTNVTVSMPFLFPVLFIFKIYLKFYLFKIILKNKVKGGGGSSGERWRIKIILINSDDRPPEGI